VGVSYAPDMKTGERAYPSMCVAKSDGSGAR
jgi:hypothetical protein